MWNASGYGFLVIGLGHMKFRTKSKVNAFLFGPPALNMNVLIQSRAPLEMAQRCGVPSKLDKSSRNEWAGIIFHGF
jgi:hypothetical protein